MGTNVTRLYDQFKPRHYILEIKPDAEKLHFSGSIIISGHKTKPSKRLTFHQKDLNVTKVSITRHSKKNDDVIVVERINFQNRFDELRLHTEEQLLPGSYTVRLEFEGEITKQMNGLYPCFFAENEKEERLLATQFESHHAREVFPCIDEPEAKATFDLTVITPLDDTVIANTPVKKQEEHGQLKHTSFETTPHMSTYLLAFISGKLGYKEAKTKDGVLVRTYSTPENVKFTDFALDMAVKTLEFYNDYFGIDYPLEKCDMVALPDFASGAMENWGAITYREQCMLVDPANSTLPNKQYVAMVVAHELAHQWFGNLVTMRWWTDLWLNEGFASWIEYMAVDHVFPQWQMWTQFAVDEQQRAYRLDALEHTHPVEVAVHHPDEIRTIFDTISYSKGASAIHMLHTYLGADAFRDGLRHYLKTHAYGNTDTVDLWSALEEISGKPVRHFMQVWTSSSGFPLLTADVSDDVVTISQQRFFINPEHEVKDKTLWPVSLQSQHTDMPDVLETQTLEVNVRDSHALKLNRGQSGFYRVVYNSSHLKHLGEEIKKGHLEPLDRLGILSDLFEAAKAGRADTADALHFLGAFMHEDDNAVWDIIASSISGVRAVMDDEALREAMKPYLRELTAGQLKRLGWTGPEDEPYFDKLLRPTIVGMSAMADEPGVVKEALRLFDKMKIPEDIEPDMRGIVYATAVRNYNNQATYTKLLDLHESSTLAEERMTLAGSLTGFKDPALIKKSLTLISSPSVRLQDVGSWVAYSFMNRFARDQAWQWMKDNWEWMNENLGTDLSFSRFPMYAASAFSNRDFLEQFNDFFAPRKTPAFERSVSQGVEVIQWQSAWRARDFKEVQAFFTHHSQNNK